MTLTGSQRFRKLVQQVHRFYDEPYINLGQVRGLEFGDWGLGFLVPGSGRRVQRSPPRPSPHTPNPRMDGEGVAW